MVLHHLRFGVLRIRSQDQYPKPKVHRASTERKIKRALLESRPPQHATEKATRFFLRELDVTVAAAGHEIFESEDGKQGLDDVEEHQPDGIVFDLMLPRMDGHEFLRHLRASGTDVPIIVTTSDDHDTTRAMCNEIEVTTFLTKPVEGNALVASVNMGIAVRGKELLFSHDALRSVEILVVDDSKLMRMQIRSSSRGQAMRGNRR